MLEFYANVMKKKLEKVLAEEGVKSQLNENCCICFKKMTMSNIDEEEKPESKKGVIEIKDTLEVPDSERESLEKSDDSELFLTGCKHLFHKKCLEPWIYTTGKCPICKVKINLAKCYFF